jgi:hypothetical protein
MPIVLAEHLPPPWRNFSIATKFWEFPDLFSGESVIAIGVLAWSTIVSKINEANNMGFKLVGYFDTTTVSNRTGKAYYYIFETSHPVDKPNLDKIVLKFASENTLNEYPKVTAALFYRPGLSPKPTGTASVEEFWNKIANYPDVLYLYYTDGATPAYVTENPKGPWK